MMPLMMFAAGFGTRMGALTADRPKPLIPVAGQALIDHALAVADGARIRQIVVNLHYRGDQIRAHLAGRRHLRFSDEPGAILETGGGLRQAMPFLGEGPVLTLNTDAVWTGNNPLIQLMAAWDPVRMDGLLLLLPVAAATGHDGRADFGWHPDGRIDRGGGDETHVYVGAQILKTEGLADMPEGAFSLNRLWDQMIAGGRAFGVVHQGGWCDVGTPEGIAQAEVMLQGVAYD
jgi:N-acetyl-alpha-D-muramate 1-phosphate uridylyltransferase